MTNSHEILIPLMSTAFIAAGTSQLFNPVPLYRALSDSYKLDIKKAEKTDAN
jgi:H+/Cl- antiporter ClcA